MGAILRELSRETGLSMDNLSVLKADHDPYRLDTYRNGQWFRRQMEVCGLIHRDGGFARPIHNRGIHYATFSKGATRPDSGRAYLNDADGRLKIPPFLRRPTARKRRSENLKE